MMRPPTPEELSLLEQATGLHQAGNLERARLAYHQVLPLRPEDPDLLRLAGALEIQLGHSDLALELIDRSLAVRPAHPGALYNRALALQSLGRFDEAVASYDQTLTGRPDYADAYVNRGNCLLELLRYDEAVASYDRALAIERQVPPTYLNRAIALTGLGKLEAAAACYRQALALDPTLDQAHTGLAGIYELQKDYRRAVVEWSRLAERGAKGDAPAPSTLWALQNMARILADHLRDYASAETVARQSLRLNPNLLPAAQEVISARQRMCAWPIVEPFDGISRQQIQRGMSPLSAVTYTDDPMFQLALNAFKVPRDEGEATALHRPKEALAGERLRIGYLSADLLEHPVGHLMYEVPGLHDRGKVEVFAYYCGPKAADPIHQHYRSAFEHFVDLDGVSDADAARRIADDGIQILIDVTGHTLHGRKGVVARRPAPVIVNWLGFPGSMGSPYHHYILADDWIAPAEHEVFFSESVLRLPCYQPNNRRRVVSERAQTRTDAGLPADAFVFCSFNDTKKITSHTFDRWLTILERTPGSVLWMLTISDATQANLRAYAAGKGIDPSRIVFAPFMRNADHLARYPLADLFLDSMPCGAHTTCSDALWMGVPVVTLSGRSFASRVSGSLLRQAGLEDLVFTDADGFVEGAVALAHDLKRLRGCRDRLIAARETSGLFDTPRLVAALEDRFEEMWRACMAGALPIPDLRNMEAYLEIGLLHDHEAQEVEAIEDYGSFVRERLAQYARSRPLVPDNRFWDGA